MWRLDLALDTSENKQAGMVWHWTTTMNVNMLLGVYFYYSYQLAYMS
jgi:hypothetical protein